MAVGVQGSKKDRGAVTETERQLLDAIRGGDPQALRRLYDRYSRYTMAVGLRYIHDRSDMDDVLQDSFVSILGSIDRFRYKGEGSLKAWVSRIVTNRAVDWLKEHRRIKFVGDIPDEIDEEKEIIPEIDAVPPEILNRMIRQLPVGCRTVLNLYVFEQIPHKDIARRLNIKEKTSHSQYAHARRLLEKMIREYISSQRI